MKTTESSPRIYSEVITINVDVQNDFALPDGLLSVKGGEEVVEPLNDLNTWTRENGGSVIFTQDWHPQETAHFAINGGIWPVHCVQNTKGAQLHAGLRIEERDEHAYKGMSLVDDGYSGLEGLIIDGFRIEEVREIITRAELEAKTRKYNLAIIIGGLATDFCDKATALDSIAATSRDYTDVILAEDAVRAVNLEQGDGDAAIAAMKEAGVLAMTTQEIIRGGIVIDRSRLER